MKLIDFNPENYCDMPEDYREQYQFSEGVRISLQSPYDPCVVGSGNVEYFHTVHLLYQPDMHDKSQIYVIEAEDFLEDLESVLAENPKYKDLELRFTYMKFFNRNCLTEVDLEPVLYQPEYNRFYFKAVDYGE